MLLLLILTAANAQMLGGGGAGLPPVGGGGTMVGGQTGQCCGSCGYLWCQSSQSCYRPSSETCSVQVNQHGCPMDCAQYHKDYNLIDCSDGSTISTMSWSSVGNCQLTKFAATITPTMAPSVTNLGGGGGLVGGTNPVTGCCTTCGYMYCASLDSCYRPWMVAADYCPVLPASTPAPIKLIGGTNPTTGCCSSCGEVLCQSTGQCYRPWLGGCAVTVNQHGCPTGCLAYHKSFNVIDCNDGSVLRTESWSSVGNCVDTAPPTPAPTMAVSNQVPTSQYCSALNKKDCKKKTNRKLCKFKKKTACSASPTAPAMITPPVDQYQAYSASCTASSTSTDCADNGCDWSGGVCYAFSADAAKCSKFKDPALCAAYGCKSKKGKCRGKPKNF